MSSPKIVVPVELEYLDTYVEAAGLSAWRDGDTCVIELTGTGDGVIELSLDRDGLSAFLDQLAIVEDEILCEYREIES